MQLAMPTGRKWTVMSHQGMGLANYFANPSGDMLRGCGCLSMQKQNCEYKDWRKEQLGLVHLKESLPTSSPRRLKRRQKYCKTCFCGVSLCHRQTFYICWSVSSAFGESDLCSASAVTCRSAPFHAPAV